MSGFVLRPAVRADAEAIAAIHAASWQATYRGALTDAYLDGDILGERRAVWHERLGTPAPNQHVVVAADGEHVVGFACAFGVDDERFGTQLDNLHVRSARQSVGTGARLVATVAKWCAETHPGTGLYLWVVEQNEDARRFYARLGGADVAGDVWVPPDGSQVPTRRIAWTPAEVQRLAYNAGLAAC